MNSATYCRVKKRGQKHKNVSCHPSGEATLKHPFQQHFCCLFLLLNSVLVFTENNVLSGNTLNASRNVVILRVIILLEGNRGVFIMILWTQLWGKKSSQSSHTYSVLQVIVSAQLTVVVAKSAEEVMLCNHHSCLLGKTNGVERVEKDSKKIRIFVSLWRLS